MLTQLLMTTPNGAIWADARACGSPANADQIAMQAAAKRPHAGVFGGSYGTHAGNAMVSDGTTKRRPQGLGGSTG